MKFKLTFEATGNNRTIPINYQYELSAWIYKTIHYGNAKFAEWLHTQGYTDGHKQFKLFTFSNLSFGKYSVKDDRLEILSGPIHLTLSFYMGEAAEPFITGLFHKQEFTLGDRISQVNLRVLTIEKMPEPDWKATLVFRTESPIVIGIKENPEAKSALYISPEHADYGDFFIKNLVSKYLAIMSSRPDSKQTITFNRKSTSNKADRPEDAVGFKEALTDNVIRPEGENTTLFRLLGKPRSKIIKIKADNPAETQIKGFLYEFELTAPVELLKLGYYAGFGEKNSLGFGCCRIIK